MRYFETIDHSFDFNQYSMIRDDVLEMKDWITRTLDYYIFIYDALEEHDKQLWKRFEKTHCEDIFFEFRNFLNDKVEPFLNEKEKRRGK